MSSARLVWGLCATLCLFGCGGGGGLSGDGATSGDGGASSLPPREQSPPELIGGMFSITHSQSSAGATLRGAGVYYGPTRIEPGQFPEYSYYANIPLDECVRDIAVILSGPSPIEGGPGVMLEGPGGRLPMSRVELFGSILYQGEGAGALFAPQRAYTLSGGASGTAIGPFTGNLLYSPAAITLTQPDLSQPVPYDSSAPLVLRWTPAGDGEPVFVDLRQLENGSQTKRWICRFDDDGQAELPTWVLQQLGGVTDFFVTLEVDLKVFKYRWTPVALDGAAPPALVLFSSEWKGTIDVPSDF